MKPGTEPVAPPPKNRVREVSPFQVTGIDFMGPLYIKEGTDKVKVYILLLTCVVVRAIHLELVRNLSKKSSINALRRFMSSRGVPKIIYSDNAKTFKGASAEIEELSRITSGSDILCHYCSNVLNGDLSSWWGGFWERLIKTVKDALKLTVGRPFLNYDDLQTVSIEIEAVVNNRPLTYVNDNSEDLLILTLAFIAGDFKFSIEFDRFALLKKRFTHSVEKKTEQSQEFLETMAHRLYSTVKISTFRQHAHEIKFHNWRCCSY